MVKKKKSAFKESFSQGLGSEMGKRTAIIIFSIIALIILVAWGILKGNDSTQTNEGPKIDKTNDNNGNVE